MRPKATSRYPSPTGFEPAAILLAAILFTVGPFTAGQILAQETEGAPAAGEDPAGGIGIPPGNERLVEPIEGLEPGDRVDIAEGEIEIEEFLRFLSSYTGMPVFVDSAQIGTLKPITIVAPIIGADEEIVKALLEANRMEVQQKELTTGRSVLVVKSTTATVTGQQSPQQMPIIRVGPDDTELVKETVEAEFGIDDDQVATMVFHLKHVEPKDAIDSLSKLLGSGAQRRQRRWV